MSNFLVLTNFTPSSHNATLYALQIAKNIRANITLCHVISGGNDQIRREKQENLRAVAERLMHDDRLSGGNGYNPVVDYTCQSGKITEVAKRIYEDRDIAVVVIGMSGSGGGLFSSSTSKDIIDEAEFPLLGVPVKAAFNGLGKIAFATSLRENDIDVVSSIAEIARAINPEILLAHVTNEKFDNDVHKLRVNHFINTASTRSNYGKIFYRHIKSVNIDQGLNWLATNGNVNMLAIVHRKQKGFSLFESSHTHHLAKSTGLPLLVYPPANVLVKTAIVN
ncbi:hypothetical protein EOD41_03200 [Mucilaginibacter limnophilus]|uniref:UspA domain-containing protein n=1 Tax=Mucilaginibacter limnophilus TaxID=1932778 RepID=A0A437MZ79_9SPHI|nr:universal stress protein [Mucilaginibacter limnophilus]RVU02957.1 hypothetical protein EOD41_03200 [Mucilaginibacter limnophilus]